jgi:hypothetical protein
LIIVTILGGWRISPLDVPCISQRKTGHAHHAKGT